MVRSEALEQRAAAADSAGGAAADPRVAALRRSVDRVRRELAAHPAELPDRQTAEEELAGMEAMARDGLPELPRLRGALLLVAAALGSVSALAAALAELRQAVELFGDPAGSQPGPPRA
ncbi:DUF5955 family protein [Streptomyces sp. JJ36]|uniref:DUF5955 family protein n=1 Tax=Streptomyces sp. JJ36 TaxID=2736645 RepID=UPI001F2BFD15|nr:DUF5955 family protein [Streptomyces sp. JJ36]MCF6522929.1 hypothetical protein [Streptomyces sp. JJ36]